MLKTFEISYATKDGGRESAVVEAFDNPSAVHAFRYGHPELGDTPLTCSEIAG